MDPYINAAQESCKQIKSKKKDKITNYSILGRAKPQASPVSFCQKNALCRSIPIIPPLLRHWHAALHVCNAITTFYI